MGYSIAYNSGSTTPFGTYKQGTITMGLKPDEYTVSSGFTWYANAEYTNDAYLIISDTYSQGWSTQAEAKPTIWRSETGTTESFVALVNQLPDVNGVTGFTDSGTAMEYLQSTGKYFVSKDDYLGIVTDGLVLNLDAGWYPSYSGSGTTWKDLKGSNNVTLINGPTFSTDNNGNLNFDGTDDYADFFAPNLSSVACVEIWIKLGANFNRKMIMGWNQHTIWSINGGIGFNTYQSDVYGLSSSLVTSLGLVNNWRQYVFIFNAGVSYVNNNIYINGVNQTLTQVNSSEQIANINFNNGNGRISGAKFENSNYRMPMNVGSFKIYNRKLSSSEILQNYNATKGRFGL